MQTPVISIKSSVFNSKPTEAYDLNKGEEKVYFMWKMKASSSYDNMMRNYMGEISSRNLIPKQLGLFSTNEK